MKRMRAEWLLAAIVVVYAAAAIFAMRKSSTTFDEIVMIAGGARGYQTGDWLLAPEHPPVTQYVYGLLPYLAGAQYPDESRIADARRRHMGYRYEYAQGFFWNVGNDPERLAFLGRLPAVLFAIALIVAAFAFTRTYYGSAAGLGAATLVAFLPDMLAHGGIAYNDIAVACAFFAAMWRLDVAIRKPVLSNALLAGATTGLALGIKNSAVGLALLAVLLLAAEAFNSWRAAEWRKRVAVAAAITVLAMYVTLVIIYRGDATLTEYRYALSFVFRQVADTRAPAYLLGRISTEGFWYYFPVSFLLKTSAAWQLLFLLATFFYITRLRSVQQLLASPLRAPALGALVFAFMLARSQLHIGFRYALPILPLLAVLVAPAVVQIWSRNWHRLRPVVAIAMAWLIIHPLTYFPNFLAYVNEYGPGRDRGYEVFADSSLDWGQGLLQLRDYMREHDIGRVYLSYFGSALPAGYGIDYEPLPSFFALPRIAAEPRPQPQYAAISATHLTGVYFGAADPYRRFREMQPDHVIGHTIFLYRINE